MIVNIQKYLKVNSYWLAPFLGLLLGLISILTGLINLKNENQAEIISSVVTAAGIISSVLITNYTIILALPEDKASVKSFRKHQYFRILTRHIVFGTMFFLFAILLSITILPIYLSILLFFMGCGNLFASGFILYNILLSFS